MASGRIGTLYIGVTRDLIKRVYEHKNKIIEGFKKKHNVHDLVYYEVHESMEQTIIREKQMKKWKRKWKIDLIEKNNFQWRDLYEDLI